LQARIGKRLIVAVMVSETNFRIEVQDGLGRPGRIGLICESCCPRGGGLTATEIEARMKGRIDDEITFRKLEVLLAFMRTGNLAKVAEQLDTTTVSVHRALHSLEAGLGCQLFRNEGRNLVATQAATVLAGAAEEVIEHIVRGIALTRQEAGFSSTQVRLGSLYSLTSEVMPQVLMDLKLRRPELRVELVLGSNDDLKEKLLAGQVDAVVMGVEEGDTQVESVPLFEDEVFFAVPGSSEYAGADLIDLKKFAQEDFVSLSSGFVTYRGFRDAFQVAGFEPKVVARVGDIYSLMNLVAGGVGFTLLPGRVRGVFAERVKLVPLLPPFRMRQHMGLTFLRARERDPNILSVAAACRMTAGRLFPQSHAA
jgi:LysR family malonate utilization transcriptional regulator